MKLIRHTLCLLPHWLPLGSRLFARAVPYQFCADDFLSTYLNRCFSCRNMRTCCAGQSVFHGTSKPRLSIAPLTRASIRPGDPKPQRKHADSFRKVTPAAVSAPDSLLAQKVDSNCPTEADERCALLERAVSSANAERPSKSGSSGRETLESPEELASTSGHRAIVGTAMLLLAGIGAQGFAGIHGAVEGACVCAAVAIAFVLAGNVNSIHVTQFVVLQAVCQACIVRYAIFHALQCCHQVL